MLSNPPVAPDNSQKLASSGFMIIRYQQPSGYIPEPDMIASEAPLEIRLTSDHSLKPDTTTALTVTMRTPGDDLSLVTGFLFTENLIDHFKDIKTYKFCGRPAPHGTDPVAILCLNRLPTADDTQIRRNFVSHGGCGLCGKASLESISINQLSRLPAQELKFPTDLSILLPEILGQMRRNQKLFRQTGGLHGSAIFSRCGDILCLKEDIGRHNALDKTIGWMLAHYPEELPTGILLLSGRVSWELMQKAIRAQIPCVIAVGAPSSMAVEMARYFNVSLIGFAKPESFNIYHNNGYILEAR